MKGAFCVAVGIGLIVFESTIVAQGREGAAQGRGSAAPARGGATQARGGAVQGPAVRVQALWPQPLPNHWILGSVTGVTVDAQDHVWVTHRGADSLGNNEKGMMLSPPTSSICCIAAPPVLEFDQAGKVVSQWGGPGQGYAWPQTPAGIAVDAKGNVWITGAGNPPPAAGRGRGAADAGAAPARGAGAPDAAAGGRGAGAPDAAAGPGRAGRGAGADAAARGASAADTAQAGRGRGAAPAGPPQDAHVLKFSRTGQFLLQIGQPGKIEGANSQTTLNRPAALAIDEAANEVYVADGLGNNHRIIVFDSDKGAYKRHWGAYGERPTDAEQGPYDPNALSKQFRDVTCVEIAKDGMVYVCDRGNNRIQVFQKDGKFVKEMVVSKMTRGDGAAWDVAFSNDPQQRYLYVADGQDKRVLILNRDTLAFVGSFGEGGRNPGRFLAVGSVAVDSKGTIYTGENLEGKRVQKWTSN